MKFIVAIILLALAFAFIVWCLNNMLTKACPKCQLEDNDEIVIPVLPGYRWWCPSCNSFYPTSELYDKSEDSDSDDNDNDNDSDSDSDSDDTSDTGLSQYKPNNNY